MLDDLADQGSYVLPGRHATAWRLPSRPDNVQHPPTLARSQAKEGLRRSVAAAIDTHFVDGSSGTKRAARSSA